MHLNGSPKKILFYYSLIIKTNFIFYFNNYNTLLLT